MKKIVNIALLVTLLSVCTAWATVNINTKCNPGCCKTEKCKKACVESDCCKKDKTCDITEHKNCKHKCCDTANKMCKTEEKASCCTKK